MAISKCISLSEQNKIGEVFTDAALLVNETGYHGTIEFPVAVYLDDVSHQYVNWHWHEEFEIGFITEGTVILGCGNRSYRAECGDIFFINSNVLHSMHKDSDWENAVFKSIAFHSSVISDNPNSVFYTRYLLPILSNVNLKEFIITREHSDYQSILDLIVNVWNLVYTEDFDYEIQVRNDLSTLFCMMNRLLKTMEFPAPDKIRNYLPEKRVQILLDYIHAHYRDKITIEDLAKAASISKTEVLRCFKAIMGLSPISYLNSYRLQRAAIMLGNTDNNIQEIAVECGFDNNSYFSKLFKKKYQVAPRDFMINASSHSD